MDYPPVQAAHLQQIHELNTLFLNLVSQPPAQTKGLSGRAQRLVAGLSEGRRRSLAALPRALFQLDLPHKAGRADSAEPTHALRAFALTALLVAFNMLRDSAFAARVLFAGSDAALDLLADSQLTQLIEYSTRSGLIICPLLEIRSPASRFLAGPGRPNGDLSRDARIALAQARSSAGSRLPALSAAVAALSRAN